MFQDREMSDTVKDLYGIILIQETILNRGILEKHGKTSKNLTEKWIINDKSCY